MKRIFIIILTGSIFFTLSALIAGEKEKKTDDFLRANPNIKNEELRLELGELRKAFDVEKTRIQENYHSKMEVLKIARKNEVKTLKNDFAERRELLFKKYPPKKRHTPKMANPDIDPDKADPVDAVPKKKKVPSKDKKRIRKP